MRRFTKVVCGLSIMTMGLAGFGLSAQAVPLLPGVTLPAVGEADPTGGTTQAGTGTSVAFASSPGVGSFSGTLTSTVISNDPSNLLGGLTFVYRISNDGGSASSLERMTNVDFTGFLTDVSYQTTGGGTAPASFDRDATGSTVGWLFSPLGSGRILPGASSTSLVIQTNATAFGIVNANIIDGSIASVQSFGPVPEPGSIAAIAGFAILGIRRRSSISH